MTRNDAKTMIWDMIDTHIRAINISERIFVEIQDLDSNILGTCSTDESECPTEAVLTINEKIFSDTTLTNGDRNDIICHELAHLICGGEWDHADGHSEMWKQICLDIGGKLKFY